MIKYYCNNCKSYIEHKLIDKNTNKCLICKQNLDKVYEELGSFKKMEVKKYLNNLRNEFNDSYVKHEYSIYWSKEETVPVFNEITDEYREKNEYLSSDVRPVFPEEQLLLQILLKDEYKILNRSVWYTAGRQYICKRQVLFHKNRQLISHKKRQLIFHTLPFRLSHRFFRGILCFLNFTWLNRLVAQASFK